MKNQNSKFKTKKKVKIFWKHSLETDSFFKFILKTLVSLKLFENQ